MFTHTLCIQTATRTNHKVTTLFFIHTKVLFIRQQCTSFSLEPIKWTIADLHPFHPPVHSHSLPYSYTSIPYASVVQNTLKLNFLIINRIFFHTHSRPHFFVSHSAKICTSSLHFKLTWSNLFWFSSFKHFWCGIYFFIFFCAVVFWVSFSNNIRNSQHPWHYNKDILKLSQPQLLPIHLNFYRW